MNRLTLAAFAVVALGAGALILIRLPQSTVTARKTEAKKENILDAVHEALRKDPSYEVCRGSVQQLNSHLAQHPEQKPATLTDAERTLLTSRLGLDPDEVAEVQSNSFTLLDAHHLDTCLLFNDVARSLGLDDQPSALKRAAAALGWVTRQVRLRERDGALLPPQFVLRRGWGTSLERALVFLALLDQLGLESCMIAVPEGPGTPTMRYWIPGVLSEGQIYLFETRLGVPLPGPEGKGTGTLAQVRGQPELLRLLTLDEKQPYDVTAEQAKRAEVHLVCALSALAPRMQFLQTELASTDRVSLAVKATTLLENFQAACKGPGLEGTEVRFWSQPADPNAPTRILRRFVPPEEGGADKTNRRAMLMLELIPLESMPRQIQILPGEPGQRLRQFFAEPFISFAFAPKRPRDLMLHGHFDEATTKLVSLRDELERNKTMLQAQTGLDQKVEQWCAQAIETYATLIRAEREGGGPGARTGAVASAQAKVDDLWKRSKEMVMLVQAAAAEPFAAEATYLLALCKHEQAERSQAKLDSAQQAGKPLSATDSKTAQIAWRAAADWWDTFLENHSAVAAAASARLHRARAALMLGQRDTAVNLLQNLSGNLTPLEKTGRLYQAQQLQLK
jgi:hypothetical protein